MNTIPDFSSARVLVIGDVMLDRYWHGPCQRISPEAPVPVVKVDAQEERLGGAANVAANIARLGADATVLGLVGEDDAGKTIVQQLAAANVRSGLLAVPDQLTTTKLRVLSRNQQLIRLDFEDGFTGFNPQRLLMRLQAQLTDDAVVVIADYGKGVLRDAATCIDRVRAAGNPVLVDPVGNDFGHYRNATMITPNQSEFQAVVGRCRDDSELVDKGMRLIDDLAVQALLITRSEQGMTLLQREKKPFHLQTRAREVYDVTGAGDTVIAVLAAAIGAGYELPEATTLANNAAGLVVARLGTASVTAQELAQSQSAWVEGALKDETALLDTVDRAKSRGERIVMTNGCFDILHSGHVAYLEQAKQLGDRLIIAVNTDASVRLLKGERQPVNPLISRMRVLAALSSVDWVVPFAEDTPERLVCSVLPHYLVKGGDYNPDDIAGAECVRNAGGEVLVLDYFEGNSTSAIIERILKT